MGIEDTTRGWRQGRNRLVERLASGRGAVFVEFAMTFPIVLALTLMCIQLCMFWDATAMANHTAFTLARIAKVSCAETKKGQAQIVWPEFSEGVASWLSHGSTDNSGTIVASILMSSVTTGFMLDEEEKNAVN